MVLGNLLTINDGRGKVTSLIQMGLTCTSITVVAAECNSMCSGCATTHNAVKYVRTVTFTYPIQIDVIFLMANTNRNISLQKVINPLQSIELTKYSERLCDSLSEKLLSHLFSIFIGNEWSQERNLWFRIKYEWSTFCKAHRQRFSKAWEATYCTTFDSKMNEMFVISEHLHNSTNSRSSLKTHSNLIQPQFKSGRRVCFFPQGPSFCHTKSTKGQFYSNLDIFFH